MKKLCSMALAVGLALSLTACGGSVGKPDKTEVIVFAAASLEATLTEIAENYRAVAPEVELVYNFDSSGTLRTQIREGADCHLFISAGQSQMDDLEELALIQADSRVDFVENKVVLAVPEGNPAGISGYEDLAGDRLELLCIGNEDVPVGGYSLQILENLGIDLKGLEGAGKVSYGSNVTEVATQIKEGTVSCGIIYATDAATHQLTVIDEADVKLCGQVIYPAALTGAGDQEAAGAFLEYLRTDGEARAVLEGVGFTVLG